MKLCALMTLFILLLLSCSEENKNLKNDVATQDSLTTAIEDDNILQDNSANLTPVERIKKDYQVLQNKLSANKLDSTKITYENDEISGEVVFYKENDTLKVIKYSYAEHSHFSSEENYHIKDGNLFFAYIEDVVWSFDGGTREKSETKDEIVEKRFYFDQNNPILCLEKKYTIKSDSSTNPESKDVSSKEVKCNVDGVLDSYQKLLKNSDKNGKVSSL